MANITAPKEFIPIGTVRPDGTVTITLPWLRYLAQDLFNRVGGTSGSSTDDVEAAPLGMDTETFTALLALQQAVDSLPPAVPLPAPDDNTLESAALSAEVDVLRNQIAILDDNTGEIATLSAEVDALRERISALEQGLL